MQLHRTLAKNLKRTNFILGFNQEGINTQYRVHYPPHTIRSSSANDPSRKSNIVLGTDINKTLPQSEVIQNFKDFSKIVESTTTAHAKEHKRSHFAFGFQRPKFDTTSSKNYWKKTMSVEPGQQYTESLNRSYQNNVIFGDDLPSRKSINQTQYVPKSSRTDGFELATANKKNQKMAHFAIGSVPVDYRTHHAQEFSLKPINHNTAFRYKENNIDLGHNKSNFETISKSVYKRLPLTAANNTRSVSVRDRQTHFRFTNPAQFETTSHTAHGPLPITLLKAHAVSKKANFTMGYHDNPVKSSYYDSYNKEKKTNIPESQKPSILPNVHLGFHPEDHKSEAQANFTGSKGKASQLNPERKKFLKKSHFNIGEGKGEYETVYQEYGVGQGEANCLDENQLKDMKATHFSVGNDAHDYLTEHTLQFGGKDVGDYKLESRSYETNVLLGMDPKDFDTVYQIKYCHE